ncbi:DUF3038 domain-containing protein [Candidatus Gracilibacteria bacterium]|jgi:Protein of unknown function (DUF3038)|nr:DUF3038 domain-containing protein [Candidatus Gracilibacteria bacterium]NJM90032.1 DUF3038 domain-containing protein [Hydrococcus sp. RU_2_2]NJP18660.1 DUF3038 domain-containing protein [Hydrococcus sp. CRU_1_1]
MGPIAKISLSPPRREDLLLPKEPDVQQLDNIKAHLDIVLLALEALIDISSEDMLKAAQQLNLDSIIADRVGLWRLRQSNPLRKSSGGRKKLDVEEARSLVLIICYLAKQQHELIRRAVTLLEQITEQNKAPHQTALLGDYLDAFTNGYQERMEEGENVSSEQLSRLALKLLVDLLFYSSANGHRRLWLALLDYAR